MRIPGIAMLKSLSWKKKLFIGIVIIAGVVAVAATQFSSSENGYVFETVSRQTVSEVISESGNITTAGITSVYSPSTGIIEEVYVENGDIVGIDQELFKVKSTATEDEIATAYSALAAAQSSLKTAQQTKITLQSSLEAARQAVLDAQEGVDNKDEALSTNGNAYSQNEADSIDSELTAARISFNATEKKYLEADVAIRSAQAALQKANLAYESTKDRVIKSSTIGTIANLSIGVGSSVTASTQSLTAAGTRIDPVLTIANFSASEIILPVNESDISSITPGQKAHIYPDALDNAVYEGIVRRIDSIGDNDQGVVTYDVYIDVTNADEAVKSGMTVDVEIETNTLENTLAVPNTALKPYQGGRAVRILNRDTNEVEYVPVTLGVRGEKYTQILDGLIEGQEIIVSLTNEQLERSSPLGF